MYLVLSATTYQRLFGRGSSSIRSVFRSFLAPASGRALGGTAPGVWSASGRRGRNVHRGRRRVMGGPEVRHAGHVVVRRCALPAVGRVGAGELLVGPQLADGRCEVVQALESAVDGGEAHIGDLVEVTQRPEDRQAHVMGRDLGGAGAANRLLDLLGELSEGVLVDGPPRAGLADAVDHLRAAERLGGPRALEDRERGRLHGGEAAAALGAGAAATDRGAVIRLARVDDPGVGVPAERTVHSGPLSLVARCGFRTGRLWICGQPVAQPVEETTTV